MTAPIVHITTAEQLLTARLEKLQKVIDIQAVTIEAQTAELEALKAQPVQEPTYWSEGTRIFATKIEAMQSGAGHAEATLLALYSAPVSQPALTDAARLDHLQNRGATVEILPNLFDSGMTWRFRIGGLYKSECNDIRSAIDIAIAAAVRTGGAG